MILDRDWLHQKQIVEGPVLEHAIRRRGDDK